MEVHLKVNFSLNSLLDSLMDFRSFLVRILAASSNAFLLFSLCPSVNNSRRKSPHSLSPLAFSRRLLISMGTDIVAYFLMHNTVIL